MALFANRLAQMLGTRLALPGGKGLLLDKGGRCAQLFGMRAASSGIQGHAEHVSKLGLSRAQESEKESTESQAAKQEKANWIEREPGLEDKNQADCLPQDNLRPEGLGTTVHEATSRPGMFDPGSFDLRHIKELKAADVIRQQTGDNTFVDPAEGGGVKKPQPDGENAPERPGKEMNEEQVQESVEKLGERRGGGEGLGEQTKWGATIGRSDPHSGATFSGEGVADKEFPPMHEDPALEAHRKASGIGEGDPEQSPTQVGGESQAVP